MSMTYEDQGVQLWAVKALAWNAIMRVLSDFEGENDPQQLPTALAQAVLVQLDQAGYQITRK